ncbi:peptide MFS transporter [Halocola ammonii]
MSIALWLLIISWAFVIIWIPIIIKSNSKTHPKALFILFFAEMWERFSYYGMRALLTLYMVKVLFDELSQTDADARALGIYGSYTAMVYLFPVIGGILADKILGFRKAIIFGGILMMCGHFALALEGMYFEGNLNLFFLSLSLIIIGNGFFKPNVSSFLGKFYFMNDPRKDSAFTIFYMGVNIGALLAIVTCGYIGEEISWHYGFGLAGIGMALGLLVFWLAGPAAFGNKGINPNVSGEDEDEDIDEELSTESAKLESGQLDEDAVPKSGPEASKPFEKIMTPKLRQSQILTVVATVLFVPVCAYMLDLSEFVTWLLIISSVGILGVLIFMSYQQDSKKAGQRLWVIAVLFVFHAVFWALFEQAGGSITLFTDRNVDRELMGSEVPASIFQFFNSFFIILLAPLFSWIWIKLNQVKKEPSTPMKFVLGLTLLALGFVVIVLGSKYFSESGLMPMVFIVFMYLFHTMGELCLSPVGLSMVTKLSPGKAVGFVMGAWFLSIALANKMAGLIGSLTAAPAEDGEQISLVESMEVYTSTYLTWGVLVVLGAALVLLLLTPTLRKWMHGIH